MWGTEKICLKNPLSSKSVIQNRRREKGFPKQTKTEGTHLHQTSPARDPQGDSVSEMLSKDHKVPETSLQA